MVMERLDDDALLLVLGLLSPEELLAARCVCRRWRGLALHPALWRGHRLSLVGEPFGLVARVLRVAPCLGELVLADWSFPPALAELLVSTECSIARVEACFVDSLRAVKLLREVLERQAPHLRSLTFRATRLPPAELHESIWGIVRMVASALRLVELDLRGLPFLGGGDPFAGVAFQGPSLKRLALLFCQLPPGVLGPLLRAHGQSLESVDVLCGFQEGGAARAELGALSECVRLRSLGTPPTATVARSLPGLRGLERLVMYLPYELSRDPREAREAWRRYFATAAAGLRSLDVDCDSREAVREWLVALGSSGRSELHELSIDCVVTDLHRVLPGLPRLRSLSVCLDVTVACFLEALERPLSDGVLELLDVGLTRCSAGSVPLDGCLVELLRPLLRRMPRLHLRTVTVWRYRGYSHHDGWGPPAACLHHPGAAPPGCTRTESTARTSEVCLTGHPEDPADCPVCVALSARIQVLSV